MEFVQYMVHERVRVIVPIVTGACSGVGRAGRRAAVLERVHGAARVHLPATVAAHLLRGTIPPRYLSNIVVYY